MDIIICAACLCLNSSHSSFEPASCCLRHHLSTADMHTLSQSEVLKCIYSTILPTVVFAHKPLANLAAGWIANFPDPQLITGGTLLGLVDAAVLAVMHRLVVSAPAIVAVQASVSKACGWVKLARLLLAGKEGVTMGQAGGGAQPSSRKFNCFPVSLPGRLFRATLVNSASKQSVQRR